MRRPPQPSASLLKARWALLSLRSPLNRDQCDFGPCRREGGQPRATRNLPETKDNSPSNERTVFILVLFGDIRCCSGSPFPTAVSVSVFGVVLCGPFLLLVACLSHGAFELWRHVCSTGTTGHGSSKCPYLSALPDGAPKIR